MKWLRTVRDIYSDSVFGCPVLWRQGATYEKREYGLTFSGRNAAAGRGAHKRRICPSACDSRSRSRRFYLEISVFFCAGGSFVPV